MPNQTRLPVAALRRTSKQPTHGVFGSFVKYLKLRNVKVHGLLQENILNSDGTRNGIDGLDIFSNDRIPLLRPTPYELNNKMCSLNLAQLSTATGILRRAMDAPADIVIVERFGKTEAEGQGLADDLLTLMASGIPTVVSVADDQWDVWQRFCGEWAQSLDVTMPALLAWWSQQNLNRENL